MWYRNGPRSTGYLLAAILWVIWPLATLSAQQVVAAADSIALFPVIPQVAGANSETASIAQYTQLVTDSLKIGLQNAKFQVKDAPVPASLEALWSEARRLNARIAVYGTGTVVEGRLVVQLSAYDVGSRQIIAGGVANGPIDLSLYNVVDRVARDLSSRIRAWAKGNPVEALRRTPELVRRLVFESSDEGANVLLPTGERLGTIRNGQLVTERLTVPVGSAVSIELQKKDFISRWQTVHVTHQSGRVKLDGLYPMARMALLMNWMTGFAEGGGIGLRIYLVPNWIYMGFANYTSVQPSTVAGGQSLLHIDDNIELGTYLFQGPMKRVRFSLSFGLGAIDTQSTGSSSVHFGDMYVSILNPTVDVNFGRYFAFARINLRFVMPSSGSILPAGVMGTPNLPPISVGLGVQW
ncbi:MAG TPA: hypothetical protein VMW73_13745 [Spirochaetia bacterium]|nr:hypothetical protein [Spirochaetia bacterium]